jgi:protein ECT2
VTRLELEIQELVLSLEDPLSSTDILAHPPSSSLNEIVSLSPILEVFRLSRPQELMNISGQSCPRKRALMDDNPLWRFARSNDIVIIPVYEAKTFFGNVDNLYEIFLTELERMAAPNGYRVVGRVGDVALRHSEE